MSGPPQDPRRHFPLNMTPTAIASMTIAKAATVTSTKSKGKVLNEKARESGEEPSRRWRAVRSVG